MPDKPGNYSVMRVNHLHTISLNNDAMHVSLNMDRLKTGAEKTEAFIAIARAIFDELELCGYVTASSDDHMAHALITEAPWCKLEFKAAPDGSIVGMRLRSKAADYPSREAQTKDLQATLSLLNGITLTMGPLALAIAEASTQFDKVTGATHNMERTGDV